MLLFYFPKANRVTVGFIFTFFFFFNTQQKLRFLTDLAFKEVHFHLSDVTGRTDQQKGGDLTK